MVKIRKPVTDERRGALRAEAEAHQGFKRPHVFVDPKELLQLLSEAEDLAAYVRVLEVSVATWERRYREALSKYAPEHPDAAWLGGKEPT